MGKEHLMKCPFQADEDGKFLDCIGKDCMAYFEFETYPYNPGVCTRTRLSNPVLAPMCRRMSGPIPASFCGSPGWP